MYIYKNELQNAINNLKNDFKQQTVNTGIVNKSLNFDFDDKLLFERKKQLALMERDDLINHTIDIECGLAREKDLKRDNEYLYRDRKIQLDECLFELSKTESQLSIYKICSYSLAALSLILILFL